MSYIGRNPKLKSIISEGDTIANLTAEARQAGRLVYAVAPVSKFYYDDGTTLIEVGAGDGAGVNFIGNGSAESGVSGWVEYEDGVVAVPVDGTGGTPVAGVNISASGTNPLLGTASFLLNKDAVNRQGHGYSYDFSIDEGFQGKILEIKGLKNFAQMAADNEIGVWIYDVTNTTLLEPVNFEQTADTQDMCATFQSAIDSTSYRLILHIIGTDATLWDAVKLDNVSVGPADSCGTGSSVIAFSSSRQYGEADLPAAAAKIAYSGGFGTTDVGNNYVDGSDHFVVPESGVYYIASSLGRVNMAYDHTYQVSIYIDAAEQAQLRMTLRFEPAEPIVTQDFSSTGVSSGYLELTKGQTIDMRIIAKTINASETGFIMHKMAIAKVPTGGASAGASAVIAGRASYNDVQTVPNVSPAVIAEFDTVEIDSVNMFDTGTYKYTIPESGLYHASYRVSIILGATAPVNVTSYIFIDSVINETTLNYALDDLTPLKTYDLSGAGVIECLKGDTVNVMIRGQTTGFNTNVTGGEGNIFSLHKIPSAGGSCGTVTRTRPSRANDVSTTNILDNVVTYIGFITANFDDENLFTNLNTAHSATQTSTTYWTAPRSGYFHASASVYTRDADWDLGEYITVRISVNGIAIAGAKYTNEASVATVDRTFDVSDVFDLNKGDIVSVSMYHTCVGNISLSASGNFSRFAVTEV